MQGNCARCGRKVKSEENFLKAHLWASTSVFHWGWFVTLMKEQRESGAEQAAWQGGQAARRGGQLMPCEAKAPENGGIAIVCSASRDRGRLCQVSGCKYEFDEWCDTCRKRLCDFHAERDPRGGYYCAEHALQGRNQENETAPVGAVKGKAGGLVMSLNRAMIIGYLGQDPELRHLSANEQPVASFSVATDEGFTDKEDKGQERVDWHNVVVFGKLAETCAKYLAKGRQIYVEGRLRTREYESKNGGGKRQRTEIVAQRVQFLGAPPKGAKVGADLSGDLTSDDPAL